MSRSATQEDEHRLPTNVKPTHYDLVVKTDLEGLTFHGVVKISLDIKEETSQIVLNTSNMDLGQATAYSSASESAQPATFVSFDDAQERTTYALAETLPAGSKAALEIKYSGKLTGSMTGYYVSAWEQEGKKKYYALTHFEPTSARRAFPCWDEPLLKATFSTMLISRADTVNISNTQSVSEAPLGSSNALFGDFIGAVASNADAAGWKITTFAKTPLMSTYLVAFANGHLDFLETKVAMPLSGRTLPLRIYATPDVIYQAQFALDVVEKVLPLYEKIFDVEYPLDKLDTLVASDFDIGAMENWGLITGRTSACLVDPKRADQNAKKRIASTTSHEVAHMWFGNITTMAWWDTLYLKEGFATLMGELVIPEWRVTSEFITVHLDRALSLDGKVSSHPIEVKCPDANQIKQIFDALSYSKAASGSYKAPAPLLKKIEANAYISFLPVLRMLSDFVGEDKFLHGVSLYLKNHLYGNAVTHDLWDGISTATGMDITALMDNWITKIGYPVITVQEQEDGSGITVRQDRFLETGPAPPEENQTIWNVPLNITSTKDGKTSVDKTVLLKEREAKISLDTSRPFKLNSGTTGVYRVLYTPERLRKIAEEAGKPNSVFTLDDRMGLIQDSFALAQAGFAKLSSSLTLVNLWKGETEYMVWRVIANELGGLGSIWWETPEVVEKLDAFRRALFVPLVDKLGYEYPTGEPVDATLLRTLAVSQAASAGDKKVIEELKSRFKHYINTGDRSKIPADLQNAIFTTAVKYGGREEYDAVLKIYGAPKAAPSDVLAGIAALSSPQDISLLQETTALVTNKARNQDVISFFAYLAGNFKARRLLTKYMEDEYDAFAKRFEGNLALGSLIKYANSFYSTTEGYQAVEAFYKDKDTSKYNRALAQALDSIRSRASYVEHSSDDLAEWLSNTEY
ncbi:hypothetical protein D9619_004256 [Psilocybe cf. subviscida]|uniref:Aminopeptidase n=1 Tax=Psilocybe cf. subviscida TaxID=2480587 RepID=A0A8H5BP82_9AGAR|nr:hypothetical protein D9619_004256 [Psilocybe cf. subviscida]